MPRYIDEQEAKIAWYRELGATSKRAAIAVDLVFDRVPTADVEEVRRGKWKVAGMFDDFAKCSLCGAMYPCFNQDGKPFNYCPDCGAHMDGKKGE